MKPERKVLKNGLRIIAVPMVGNQMVTTLVLVEAGSHYEEKNINGVSHFLEHMCFKGTTNRPSPTAIAHELEALGAYTNAFTWYEFTGYFAKARAKHFLEILDVVADLYLNPTVPAEELEKEKGVIIEEINMYEDMPMRDVVKVLDKTMYGDQAAGRSVLGTKKIIREMTRDTFIDYRTKHYTPEATTVVVAGHVGAEEIFSAVERYFSAIKPAPRPQKPPVNDAQSEPLVGVKFKESSQTHFQLGFRGLPIAHEDTPVLDVLTTVLGQGMSSRLFRKLREEMGVCYYVRAGSESYTDHGKVVVSSGVDNARTEEVLGVIMQELIDLKDTRVPDDELAKAKEIILGGLLMGLEKSNDLANYYGTQEIMRRPLMTPDEYEAKIRTVSSEDVQRLAQEIFRNEKASIALVGPVKDAERLRLLIRL